jgi:hypothetical protein
MFTTGKYDDGRDGDFSATKGDPSIPLFGKKLLLLNSCSAEYFFDDVWSCRFAYFLNGILGFTALVIG